MLFQVKILMCALILLLFSNISFSEVIKFKNGQIIEKAIIERTEEEIKVDVGGGASITYYLDEIESITENKDNSRDDDIDQTTESSAVDLISKGHDSNVLTEQEEDAGSPAEAIILIEIDPGENANFSDILTQILIYPEVNECYRISGEYNVLVIVEMENRKKIQDFIDQKLTPMKYLKRIVPQFLLDIYKEDGRINYENK